MTDLAAVQAYWDARPCGSEEVPATPGTRAFFEGLLHERQRREPMIAEFARFADAFGMDVLEVGCGLGADLSQFSLVGARAHGVDISSHSLELAHTHLEVMRVPASLYQSSAEVLPFAENSFDMVYSWGVLHHTPDALAAVREVHRVLRPGGRAVLMVYHRRSLVAAQVYLRFGLLNGQPGADLKQLIAAHVESKGTRAYTLEEAQHLFSCFADLHLTTRITPYDARLGRRRFLPALLRRILPNALGWFLIAEGFK